jgi:hypothetical protein
MMSLKDITRGFLAPLATLQQAAGCFSAHARCRWPVLRDEEDAKALMTSFPDSAAVETRLTPDSAVAIIGLSCRLPLAASPEAFWRLLRDGRDAIGETPASRWDADACFAPEQAAPGTDNIRHGGPAAITQHTITGLHRSIIANRVSYTLGVRGPSMTVDTGQSSSLVAVHLAVESLWREESTLALAGGVSLNLIPESALAAARFGGLSPDGRCFTFDARANGYARGEGGVADQPAVVAQRELCLGHHLHALKASLLEPGHEAGQDGAAGQVAEGRPAAQGERGLERGRGLLVAPRSRVRPAFVEQLLKIVQVQLVGAELEQVGGRRPGDDRVSRPARTLQELAQLRDVHMQRGGGSTRPFAFPDLSAEPVGRHGSDPAG